MKITKPLFQKLKITTISPVHIGDASGNLNKIEYLYDKKKKKVYFINKSKWIEFLVNNKLVDEFAKFASNPGNVVVKQQIKKETVELKVEKKKLKSVKGFGNLKALLNNDVTALDVITKELRPKNTFEWLEAKQISLKEIQEFTNRIAIVAVEEEQISNGNSRANNYKDRSRNNKVEKGLNDLVKTICDIKGNPYLPGSSIKGALRTAIVYCIVKKKPQLFNEYASRLMRINWSGISGRDFRQVEKNINNISKEIEIDVFHKLRLPDKKGNVSRESNMTNSIMQGLAVSDARCIGKKDSIILQKIDAFTKKNQNEEAINTLPIYRECIDRKTEFELSITMNPTILEKCGIKSIDEILAMSAEFIDDTINYQKSKFQGYEKELEEAKSCDLILGGGTGFLNKTIVHALLEEKAANEFIKHYLDKKFYKAKHINDNITSPRTLKVTKIANHISLMGLCKIEKI